MRNLAMRLLPHLVLPALAAAPCLATVPARAGTLTDLHSFYADANCADGSVPTSGVVEPGGGFLLGTAQKGGAYGYGSIYVQGAQGSHDTLYSFCPAAGCADGAYPFGGLTPGPNGTFYGMTYSGGANAGGTVFEITASGTLTTLYSFCAQDGCADGKFPTGKLARAQDGSFYGTTPQGGANGYGTAFRITPAGAFTTLYSFCAASVCSDGGSPNGVILTGDGNLYGTTVNGGDNDAGTVFRLTPAGAETALYSFCGASACSDGAIPYAGLAQHGKALVGTTRDGGANGAGTAFRITPSQADLTTLYSFCAQTSCADGSSPEAGLVSAAGKLYGTTFAGGAAGYGTVFSLSRTQTLTTIYDFCSQANCTDGALPISGLAPSWDGTFYGTTPAGGANGVGVLFKVAP